MKKILTAALLLTTMGISAQETYQNAEVITEELNGTARYVGMGGAMEALGADISAAGQNPAAIGLFRGNQVSASFGLTQQPNGGNDNGDSKTNMNLDQVGAVFSTRTGRTSFINWGFGYRKSANYNQMLDVVGRTFPYTYDGNHYGSSQNTLTYEKFGCNLNDLAFSQTDYLYSETLMKTDDGSGDLGCYSADRYALSRDRKGYTGSFDIMLGGNSGDKFYWGLSATIASMHYKNSTYYGENVLDGGNEIGYVELSDERKISGTGFNLKGGIILRPIEGNPFRIGLSIETPTWYDLTTENYTEIYNGTDRGYACGKYFGNGETYDYEMTTPWKFGLSAGTTINNKLAIGATLNYADYSSTKSKIKDDDCYEYDWWTDSYYTQSHSDRVMNNHTENTLKGVATFKLGAEYRLIPEVALRAGYNYVTPMYKENATRNYLLESPGTYYSSTTDYTNWKATNRFTLGIGFNFDNFSVDLAYQYSTTEGDFSPYSYNASYVDSQNKPQRYSVAAEPVSVKNDRNQLVCTLAYKF